MIYFTNYTRGGRQSTYARPAGPLGIRAAYHVTLERYLASDDPDGYSDRERCDGLRRPRSLAEFWMAALGYEAKYLEDQYALLRDPEGRNPKFTSSR